MIFDSVTYDEIARHYRILRTIEPFIRFLERKLNVSIVYNREKIPFGHSELVELMQLAALLQKKGIIKEYGRTSLPSDEVPVILWHCHINAPNDIWSGGSSVASDKDAFTAAIAEAVERYIWFTQTDYFSHAVRATVSDIKKRGAYITPERFVSYSDVQRSENQTHSLDPNAVYLWIQGRSLLTNTPVYIPAQTASAAVNPRAPSTREPIIRAQHTIGLATWPTPEGAQLAGILEAIEREAYMIVWFNQLTVPRISLESLRGRSGSLDTLIDLCARYNFKIHIIRLLTDAPTHAICAIVEDMSGHAPRFAFGVKAHRSITRCVEGAVLEALRARRFVVQKRDDITVVEKTEDVGHYDRLYYWSRPEYAKKLEFLLAGKEEPYQDALWEHDTIEEHLDRVRTWCREKKYECITIDMTKSRGNPTPWSIAMMVLPDLHPTHLFEQKKHLGGTRLQDVPKQFGYTPRETPYTDMPHPYA